MQAAADFLFNSLMAPLLATANIFCDTAIPALYFDAIQTASCINCELHSSWIFVKLRSIVIVYGFR